MTDSSHSNFSSRRGDERSKSDAASFDAPLGALECGDLRLGDSDVENAARQSSPVREKLNALRSVEQALALASQARRTDLAVASSLRGIEIDAAEDRLRERIAIALAPRKVTSWRWIAAAAGVLILAGGAFLLSRDSVDRSATSQPPIYLGDSIACEQPIAACEEFTTFRWKAELRPGSTFDLIIRDSEGHEVDRFSGLLENEVSIPAERATRLPDRIEWQVSMRDSGGVSAVSLAKAWRVR